jgi:hypothetical protein
MTEKHRFGYSGLEITLLDYTLSRAYSNEQVIYRDLENDGLFEPSKILQNQMYCRLVLVPGPFQLPYLIPTNIRYSE